MINKHAKWRYKRDAAANRIHTQDEISDLFGARRRFLTRIIEIELIQEKGGEGKKRGTRF